MITVMHLSLDQEQLGPERCWILAPSRSWLGKSAWAPSKTKFELRGEEKDERLFIIWWAWGRFWWCGDGRSCWLWCPEGDCLSRKVHPSAESQITSQGQGMLTKGGLQGNGGKCKLDWEWRSEAIQQQILGKTWKLSCNMWKRWLQLWLQKKLSSNTLWRVPG